MQLVRTFAMSTLFLATAVGATEADKPSLGAPPATCSCKGKGDCTCPRGQCKCKACGNSSRARVFESLKGATETTRLPDTARYDARGGIFI
jgi:hypothetical protein